MRPSPTRTHRPDRWMAGFIVTGGCALLVACGGGGGGGGDDPVAITSTNAELVASKTATAPIGIVDLSTFAQDILTASVHPPRRVGLAAYVLQQTRTVARTLAAAQVTASAIQTDTIPCASGQILVSANDADNDGVISVGDRASVSLENCSDDLLGGSVNGTLTIAIDTLTGDIDTPTPPYSVGVTSRFVDFAVSDTFEGQPATLTVNGEMVLAISSDDGVHVSAQIRGDSLRAEERGPTADSRSVYNYAFFVSANVANGDYTLDGHGDITTDDLGGRVHFNVSTPYVAFGVDNFPHVGVMVVTGAAESRLTITVLNATQVRLDTDENGDGTIDATATALWETVDQ